MSAGNQKNGGGGPVNRDGWRFIPRAAQNKKHTPADHDSELDDEAIDALIEADILALMSENPVLLEEGLEALERWRDAFLEKYGREPAEEDLLEQLDLITLDESAWENILDSIDDPHLRASLAEDEDDEEED